VKLYQR